MARDGGCNVRLRGGLEHSGRHGCGNLPAHRTGIAKQAAGHVQPASLRFHLIDDGRPAQELGNPRDPRQEGGRQSARATLGQNQPNLPRSKLCNHPLRPGGKFTLAQGRPLKDHLLVEVALDC